MAIKALRSIAAMGWVSLAAAAARDCSIVDGKAEEKQEAIRQSASSTSCAGHDSILSIMAKHSFHWDRGSPTSTTALLVQEALTAPPSTRALPSGTDATALCPTAPDGVLLDAHASPSRSAVTSLILEDVQRLCSSSPHLPAGGGCCDPNQVDPDFGTTPLHLAVLWGSAELEDYLISVGANLTASDTSGRQPHDMTFEGVRVDNNDPTYAMDEEDRSHIQSRPETCELSEVIIPLFPQMAVDRRAAPDGMLTAATEWRNSARAALSEAQRRVIEGKPVVIRNVVAWLEALSLQTLEYRNATSFVNAWGERPVDVGGMPEAKTLGNYFAITSGGSGYSSSKQAAGSVGTTAAHPAAAAAGGLPPNQAFEVDVVACVEGRRLFKQIVDELMPSSGNKPIVCPLGDCALFLPFP